MALRLSALLALAAAAASPESSQAGRGANYLARLRAEPFTQETEAKLDDHPFVAAAGDGTLTLDQRRAFAAEQFAIPLFCSNPRLSTIVVEDTPTADLFTYLTGAEKYAGRLLLAHAETAGMDETALAAYNRTSQAQGYPSYFARLALAENHAAISAACAINQPAWGRMCRRLSAALSSSSERRVVIPSWTYQPGDAGLTFIDFFASPNGTKLDQVAVALIEQEEVTYEQLAESVRLVQEFMLTFWDAVFAADTEAAAYFTSNGRFFHRFSPKTGGFLGDLG